MRVTKFVYTILLAFACLEQPAEAGGLGALVRATRASAVAARVATASKTFAQNAATNVRSFSGNAAGKITASIKEKAAAVRSALALTEEGKKTLKMGLFTSTVSGTISGTVSGNISGNISKNKSGKLRRRGGPSDRARMLSRALDERQQSGTLGGEEALDPGAAPEGVDQGEWDLCFWDIVEGAQVHISGENNWVQVDGLPPVCGVINDKLNQIQDSAAAIGCGDGCIKYENLDEEDFDIMADYLNGLVTA